MISAPLLAAILLITDQAATAAPSPSALKTIVNIRSTALCGTFKESVLPALDRASANDILVSRSQPLLITMAHNYVGGWEGPILMSKSRLEEIASKIEHNLVQIDRSLGDARRFPATTGSDGEKALSLLRTQMQAVAAEQHVMLNLLYGVYDTYLMGSVMQDLPTNSPFVSRPQNFTLSAGPAPSQGSTAFGAGLPAMPGTAKWPELYAPATDFSNNPFLRFYQADVLYERETHAREAVATPTLLALMSSCL